MRAEGIAAHFQHQFAAFELVSRIIVLLVGPQTDTLMSVNLPHVPTFCRIRCPHEVFRAISSPGSGRRKKIRPTIGPFNRLPEIVLEDCPVPAPGHLTQGEMLLEVPNLRPIPNSAVDIWSASVPFTVWQRENAKSFNSFHLPAASKQHTAEPSHFYLCIENRVISTGLTWYKDRHTVKLVLRQLPIAACCRRAFGCVIG